MRSVVLVLLIAIGLYGLVIRILWANQRALLYPAPRGPLAGAPPVYVRSISFPGPVGVPAQLAWRVASDSSHRWVLYFHGNGTRVEEGLDRYAQFRCLGFNVLAPEYLGYGERGGVPSEAGLERDARGAYDYLVEVEHVAPRDIVLYGWSLGSAVVVDLATTVDAAALVLENPPASIAGVAAHQFPFVPVRWLLRDTYPSDERIGRARMPVLVVIGRSDQVVPPENGRTLYALAPSPKQLVELPGGHEDANAVDEQAYLNALRGFLEPRWPPAGMSRDAHAHVDSAVGGAPDESRPPDRRECAE